MISSQLPHHVAIIMDGNGRWAKRRGLPRVAGHKTGLESARVIIETAVEYGIDILTLFAFSTENWQRSSEEVHYLLENLLVLAFENELEQLHKNNVQLLFVGDLDRLGSKLGEKLRIARELTASNSGLKLIIALSYSGKWDITQAMAKIANKVARAELGARDITEQVIAEYLSCASIPDPDLLIRTSGEQRLSNFMLWQLAYAELYFTDVLWPDFRRKEFISALELYKTRDRRFGKC